MALTHAEILALIRVKISDSGTTYGSDVNVTNKITGILKQISSRVPFITTERHPSDRPVPTRGAYTTDGTTRDIVLTDWDFDDLVGISQENGVEYEVDQEPKDFRNFVQNGKILSLKLDSIPDADENVYVYPRRLHILQSAIGTTDTALAIKTTAAIAATSLVLKAADTGTVNKYTKLTIAGDATEYMVKATATIATNEVTVTITPGLVAAATADAVVTLALADSTLDSGLEEILIKWVSGQLLVDYGIGKLATIPIAAKYSDYIQTGQLWIAEAKQDLRNLERPDRFVRHPRS